MSTYTETQGKEPFDWNAFLAKDEFDGLEVFQARELSAQWVTCACGNQCDALPRGPKGEPLDHLLVRLGVEFAEALVEMDDSMDWIEMEKVMIHRDAARGILRRIEQRSDALLKDMAVAPASV